MAPARRMAVLLAARLLLAAFALAVACSGTLAAGSSKSTDTWAVIVSSSRYWLNYRHTANALAVYQAVRRQDSPKIGGTVMIAVMPGEAKGIHADTCVCPTLALALYCVLFLMHGRLTPGLPPAAGWACRTATSCSCSPTSLPAQRATPCPASSSSRLALAAPAAAQPAWGTGKPLETCCQLMLRWTIGAARSAWRASCVCSQVGLAATACGSMQGVCGLPKLVGGGPRAARRRQAWSRGRVAERLPSPSLQVATRRARRPPSACSRVRPPTCCCT